ncbi:MAG: hypothetical protein MZV70_15090 [Desulfobacterales bacterium]|nr:hypothetical protein [Desulfobacterales bacterium]
MTVTNPFTHGDVDPDAGELALGVDLQVLVGVGRHQGGVRVQALDHALDRLVDQVLGVDFVHVFALDELDDVGEEFQPLVEAIIGVGRICTLEARACHPHDDGDHHDGPQFHGPV